MLLPKVIFRGDRSPSHWGMGGEAQTEAKKIAGISGEFLDSLLQAQLNAQRGRPGPWPSPLHLPVQPV